MTIKSAIKPIIILTFFMTLACLYFWTSSRYPELSEKTVLGNSPILSSLGFFPLIEIEEDFSLWEKILWDTVNWINTNKKGMSFSFVLGAFLLSLWPLFKKTKFNSGFKNSFLGLALGAPLGVCVNCAAPIARALYSGGGSIQTSLSALIASPTLNIVVLFMAFSLFPFYLLATKILFTLVFILILIPLACRYLFQKEILRHEISTANKLELKPEISALSDIDSWLSAGTWAAKTYFKNFFYLLKVALPLMLLSGFLGSLITTVFPWSYIENLGNDIGIITMVAIMFLLSVFGAILPAPMAFDVILSSALLQAGVPIHYVAILLFTLGSFSIYAFFIIWQAISFRVSIFLSLTTILLGLGTGFSTLYFEKNTLYKAQNKLAEIQRQNKLKKFDANEFDPIIRRSDQAYKFDHLEKDLEKQAVTFRQFPNNRIHRKPDHLQLEWKAFEKGKSSLGSEKQAFTLINGADMGIIQPYEISYMTGISEAAPYTTMAVATGDVHNDGWPDILMTGDLEVRPNLILYSNLSGKYYKRQFLPIPQDIKEVTLVALIDLNGDSWKDIIFGTYGGKNFIIYNEQGNFLRDNLHQLYSKNTGTTTAMAFGDIEKDGDLDIFWGNWNVGPLFVNYSKSQNVLLHSNGDETYTTQMLPGATGETLTSLFEDFNNDGLLDLYVGNDYIQSPYSDIILMGTHEGKLKLAEEGTLKNIVGGQSTMSIDIGDIDNDLNPDYYIGQIAFTGHYVKEMAKITEKQIYYHDFCSKNEAFGVSEKACREEMMLKFALASAYHVSDACDWLQNEKDKIKCLIHLVSYKNSCAYHANVKTPGKSMVYNKSSQRYKDFCAVLEDADTESNIYIKENDTTFAPDTSHHLKTSNESFHNILLHNIGEEGELNYVDEGNERKVGYGAWTWNSRFADLDNDSWQDIYVVNGHNFQVSLATNLFYRNKGNGHFEDKTTEFGLENYTITSAFSYFDFDNDGDLDIINIPTDAPVQIYRNNNLFQNNSIQFELHDQTTKNAGAIGGEIIIHYIKEEDRLSKASSQIGFLRGSGGFKSYNQPIIHFGLGSVTEIHALEIEWPDGKKDEIKGTLNANKRYRITRLR